VKGVTCIDSQNIGQSNFAYFPILIGKDFPITRDALYEKLKLHGIHPRRYFYPLISEFPMYRGLASAHPDNLPVASIAAQRILCLPIYPDLDIASVDFIANLIRIA
jgi:dTDP-4-amino-4,6-dideoxygalactose transaminase